MDRKFPSVFGKFTLLNVFHMGAIHTNGYIVLTFASNCTGMAADAHAVIYDKSVIHIFIFLFHNKVENIFGADSVRFISLHRKPVLIAFQAA
jgi:hypothetical protein